SSESVRAANTAKHSCAVLNPFAFARKVGSAGADLPESALPSFEACWVSEACVGAGGFCSADGCFGLPSSLAAAAFCLFGGALFSHEANVMNVKLATNAASRRT